MAISIGMLMVLSSVAAAPAWTLADFEVAASTGSWQEIVQHAGDLPPTQRHDEWRKIVQRAALGLLESQQDHGVATLETAVALVDKYPQLAEDEAFMARRAELGQPHFKQCFAQRYQAEACYQLLLHFVRQDPKRHSLAFAGAKLVHRELGFAKALPLFHRGIPKKDNAKQCGDPDAWRAVDRALDRLDAKAGGLAEAKELAFDRCWSVWKDDLARSVDQSERYLDNSCAALLQKKALSGPKLKKCKRRLGKDSK